MVSIHNPINNIINNINLLSEKQRKNCAHFHPGKEMWVVLWKCQGYSETRSVVNSRWMDCLYGLSVSPEKFHCKAKAEMHYFFFQPLPPLKGVRAVHLLSVPYLGSTIKLERKITGASWSVRRDEEDAEPFARVFITTAGRKRLLMYNSRSTPHLLSSWLLLKVKSKSAPFTHLVEALWDSLNASFHQSQLLLLLSRSIQWVHESKLGTSNWKHTPTQTQKHTHT